MTTSSSARSLTENARTAGFVIAEDGTKFDAGHGIPQTGCELLKELALERRPKVMVEIGMALGLSTAFLAEAAREIPGCRYIVVDPFQERFWKNIGRLHLKQLGLSDAVELRETFSHIVLSDLETSGVKVDFAFIDGSHLFDYVITDFLLLDRILSVGGLLIFDDLQWPAVRKAVRFILQNCRYKALVEKSSRVVPWTPSWGERLRATVGPLVPQGLRKLLAPEVWAPSWNLGVRGRFMIMEKQQDDPRGDQEMFHREF